MTEIAGVSLGHVSNVRSGLLDREWGQVSDKGLFISEPDALLNAWHIDPTPSSVREEWASSEVKKGGYNETSYKNPAFDAVVDSAVREMNPSRSVDLYRRAYKTLIDDAPAMWIYELRNVQGASKRIEPIGIRPDAWWADLAHWRVKG